jgi:hypothetical protein
MMLTVSRVVMMAVATTCSPFGLKRGPHFDKVRPETLKHGLNHMVRPNAQNLVPDFCR